MGNPKPDWCIIDRLDDDGWEKVSGEICLMQILSKKQKMFS